ERAQFDTTAAGNLAIIVTEAATNLVKHTSGGEIQLRAVRDGAQRGVWVLALDSGPGIADVARSLRDGYSTAGSPGTGLGAVARLATRFDIHSSARGTALLAELWTDGRPPMQREGVEVGVVSVPKPGEHECG